MTVTALSRGPAGADAPSSRWVPRRAGILNVWRYHDEVFEFHHGRLLLRGSNGSGKSKALELLLPFLFDASLRPNRLSTFGTSERTMHWNLMGDGATGTTRVGYVWVEFSTDDSDTASGDGRRWFVCGARLQASAHTSSAHPDYFTVHRRVVDGEFANAAGQPLTRAALIESLGADGAVHDGAAEHRAAVRAHLFGGMSEQRYESLLLALLQLRTPKLSQRLDPSLLSTLLSRALPPLGDTEITELAEGFERLDRQREDLERLDAEVAAAERLAARQRGYSRRVLRAAAAALISATSEMDTRTRTFRVSEGQLVDARAERLLVDQRRAAAALRAETATTDIEALQSRSDYQEGADAVRRLEELRRRAGTAERVAREGRTAAERAAEHARADASAVDTAIRAADVLGAEVESLSADSRAAAGRAALGSVHPEVAALALVDRRRAAGLLDAAIVSRHVQIADVRRAVATHAASVDRREHLEDELDSARDALAGATTARGTRRDEVDEARLHRADRLTAWLSGCRELRPVDLESAVAAVDDETALSVVIDGAAHGVVQELSAAAADAEARRRATLAERAGVAAELETVRARRDVEPLPVPTRTADRAITLGAPLWQLVDFAEGLPGPTQAGIEAALQASGILDAWVTPDGSVHVEGHDVLADPDLLPPAPEASLDGVLRPEEDTPVPAGRLRALLRVIAFGDRLPGTHPAAVGADGTWRLGAITGSWDKAEPEHIGATARIRARRRRIEELTAELNRLDGVLTELGVVVDGVRRRRAVLDAERAARPDRRALDAANGALDRAEAAVGLADEQVQRWSRRLAEATGAVEETLRTLAAAAAATGLPTRVDELDRLSAAVDTFRSASSRWLDRCADLSAARERVTVATDAATRSAAIALEREGTAIRDETASRELTRTVSTVEGSIGQEYHVVVAEIARLRSTQQEAGEDVELARAQLHAVDIRIATLDERTGEDARRRDASVAARNEAGYGMRALCAGPFPADAGIELAALSGDDGVRPTLEAARAVAAEWSDLRHERRHVDEAFARLAEELHASRDVLGVRADLVLEPEGDVHVLTAVAGGVRMGVSGLLDSVAAESRRAREDITAAEHELFETTLTGDTRRHLADRIRQATELVDRMNERLTEVRTASRVAVQLVWQVDPDLPAAAQTARNLLLRNPARLGDTERDALHRFFRDRVDQARADDSSTSWEQQLAEVFDYTSWHRFVVRVDRGRGEGWQLLTKKLHGALSGGEKAIALHLPLFAAVAAHYQSVPDAPRIILLDEVFVGVDAVNRGQIFALLASLDLDLVLTSDHEWCAYSELDGIAVLQLMTGDDGDDAVTTARFVWDGEDWLESEET
ncbi:TIGR02680 family protein [Pseudonocardia saturnea]